MKNEELIELLKQAVNELNGIHSFSHKNIERITKAKKIIYHVEDELG